MKRTIVLDTGPLGLITKPARTAEVIAINTWLADHIRRGTRILVPEIADYELRRELVRAGKAGSISRLDTFNSALPDRYLPITTATMRLAADLWSRIRNLRLSTADDKALDADVILAAQTLLIGEPDVIVASSNARHLVRLVQANDWRNITP